MANIINQYGQVKLGVRYALAPSITLTPLLDTYGGAAAAYSLRKMRTTYTGYAIRVRRSSDNTTLDVGFNANGELDTTALLAFVGAGDGFVSIWYDQSGNGYNFFQTTSGLQPSIVLGGVIRVGVVGKKPALRFAGQGFKNLTNLIKAEHSIFVTSLSDSLSLMSLISQWSPGVVNRLLYGLNQNSGGSQENNKINFFIDGVTNGAGIGGSMLEGNISNTSFKLLTSLSSTGSENFKTYINTALVDSATISGVNSTIPTAIGYFDQNSNPSLFSYMNELIIYNSNQLTNRTGIESNINSYYSIYTTDADAQAFITAAAITDTTQQTAINTLVTDLKAANIWTKMKALYPFVGGTAAQHRFNLKSPGTTNADFYLDFIGGGNHSANGYQPNGTTAYADTKLAPNAMGQNSVHTSVYSRTNVDSLYADIYGENGTSALGMLIKYGGVSRIYLNTLLSDNIINSNPSTGFFVASRTASATSALFQNGTKIITGTRTSLTPSPFNVYLGAGNYSGTPSLFSTRQQAFASIGDGLTDAEATAFYNAVQAYQTTLGRQV